VARLISTRATVAVDDHSIALAAAGQPTQTLRRMPALARQTAWLDWHGPGDSPWTDRELDVPGRGRTSIREAAGPPGAPALVLLHGLAATGRLNWYTALPALAERFRVVVVDHRGHGRGIRTRHFHLEDCADDAIAVTDLLGIDSLIAVGYSMGGPIAKLCWSRHRDRVRGLVLCATANHFVRPQARGLLSALFPGVVVTSRIAPDFFRDRIITGMLRGIRDRERRERARREMVGTDPATVMQATRALIRFSSHDWASMIAVPTAVVITTRDNLVSPRRQRRLAASIPHAKVFEVDADHLACVRAADRFVPALLRACEYVRERAGIEAPGC
jgi:pimeloyl-ACP methyl ester carboxylesterase